MMNKEKEMDFDAEIDLQSETKSETNKAPQKEQEKRGLFKRFGAKKQETEAQQLTKEENKKRNEALSTELLFELLKQYAWLSSAIIGSIILLVQLKVVPADDIVYKTIGCLVLSIFFALIGKDSIVDSLLSGKTIYEVSTYMKVLRYSSMFALGMGVGVFITGFVLV